MKKLLKLLVIGGFVAVVVTILRDQLLPGPTQPTSHPPPFRNVPPPPKPHQTAPAAKKTGGDDLTVVKGIGPVYAKRLAAAGVTSFRELAAADAADLAARTDLPVERVTDWIGKAGDLA